MRLVGWIGVAGAIAGLILVWMVTTRLAGAADRAVEPVEEIVLEVEGRLSQQVERLTELSRSARSGSPSDGATALATRTEQAADQLDRIGGALQSVAPAIAVVDRVLPDRFDASLIERLESRARDAQDLAADLRSTDVATGSNQADAFMRIADLADRGTEILGEADDLVASIGDAVERARSSAVRVVYVIGLVLTITLLWFGLGQTALALRISTIRGSSESQSTE